MSTRHTTSLEDAEVLLENKKYLDCQRCAVNTRLGRRILNADCPDCQAWGTVPNPMYVAAAQRAGLPAPQVMSKEKIAEIEQLMEKIRVRGVKVDRSIIEDPFKRLIDDSRRGR